MPVSFQRFLFFCSFLLILLSVGAPKCWALAYEAELPPNLATTADMCSLLPCKEVFPGAKYFSLRKGQPSYVEAYDSADASQKLLGYVMLSTDITDTPAYSGKPVVTLIGMDVNGHFLGIKVLKHSEPILLLGIPESALVNFNNQYIGKSVTDAIEVGPNRPEENIVGVDAISGATVTVVAQNQIIMASGAAVGRQTGIITPTVRDIARFNSSQQNYDWPQLVEMGLVQQLRVSPGQVGLPRSDKPWIELWFGDLNHPDLGMSLLGQQQYQRLRSYLQEGESAIFVIRTGGNESFKGSGFVRGGIFDRIQVKQGSDAFTFRDLDALNLYGIAAEAAPRYTESAIFIIRSASFSAAYPWKLAFLGNTIDKATGHRSFNVFESSYWLPEKFLEGGRPQVETVKAPWVRIWQSQPVAIFLFGLMLLLVTLVYAWRGTLTRMSTRNNKWPVNGIKFIFWIVSVFWVGGVLFAQPSITQVLTWFHSLLFQWKWSLFLSDPFIFLFWVFIVLTVFIFGRGLFCGWVCPFGALQEGIHKIAKAIGLGKFQFKLPSVWHERLKWLKYIIFIALLFVSIFSMELAERLAEVEPFKTTFLVGVLNRAWPYGLFVALILGISIVIERPYCKYICPLGAALAIPTTFRWFGLPRKQDCNSCKACAIACGAHAIDVNGRIDQRECLHCLDCLILYTDTKACPPLSMERKKRDKEGLPLTPIGKNGYFIPIFPATVENQISKKSLSGVDPRLPTERMQLAQKNSKHWYSWVWFELCEHLLPWGKDGWRRHKVLYVLSGVFALAVIAAWVMVGLGLWPLKNIIGWWFGWSLCEVLLRFFGKRYVKDGPWWKDQYRIANLMDMLSYVSFKNLLLGAMLFLLLKSLAGLAV